MLANLLRFLEYISYSPICKRVDATFVDLMGVVSDVWFIAEGFKSEA